MFVLSPNLLLLLVLVAIIGLVLLIARFRCNAFVALLLASLFVGLGSGMAPVKVVESFEGGVGKTLGFLGMIIGLGTVLGKLLAESGGAETIARTMVRLFGVKRLDYAVMFVAFLVGISVFFGVGILLLGPIAFTLARETRTPILRLALPLAAGMSTAHGLIPPHPGPMAAIGLLHADTGKTILWSLLFGLPTALVTGPLLARWVAPRVPVEIGGLGALAVTEAENRAGVADTRKRPGFAVALLTMLMPVLLMLVATVADVTLPPESPIRQWADFIGAPTVAMLISVLVAFYTFGYCCGFNGKQVLKFTEDCVAPAAAIFLVVGAGGGFSRVLNDSGVGKAIADLAARGMGNGNLQSASMVVLFVGWLIAGMLRIAVGSATVAVTTAAGLMVPIVGLVEASGGHVNRELLVLSMGAGSLILSHVNDSGFWFVKEYLGMDVAQTLRTWTVVETGIAVTSLVLILLASLVV
jgi:GntP family gluconate:H+ symporter